MIREKDKEIRAMEKIWSLLIDLTRDERRRVVLWVAGKCDDPKSGAAWPVPENPWQTKSLIEQMVEKELKPDQSCDPGFFQPSKPTLDPLKGKI